jgi:NADH/NAD ratio-sensing transcriptional regulator Rex
VTRWRQPDAERLGGGLVPKRVSDSTIRRLSHYLRALEDLEGEGTGTVSSNDLAARGGTTAAQVRKDLSQFGSFGKRGLGYAVCELMSTLHGPTSSTARAGSMPSAARFSPAATVN